MKVLFQAYHDIGRMYGGGPSVVRNLAAELAGLGVEVTFHDYWRHDPRGFDLVHYFSLYDPFNWLRRAPGDPPLVVTPISWLASSWRRRAEGRLKFALRVLRHRTRDRARLGDPFVVPSHWFPNSEGEAAHLARAAGVPRSKMTIVPHGVARRFLEGDPEAFARAHGVRDFVLCVGRFEHPRKNQLALVRALRGTGVPLVLVGGPEPGHEWYYERCRREADAAARFVGPIGHDDPLLASAYHACKVIVQPGLLESPGLVALEAALGGANVATTAGGSTREHFAELAWYFDPRDPAAIRRAVLAAHAAPRTGAMRHRVLGRYTWDRIAQAQLDAYGRALRPAPG
jgi:glycosyltransferase involved in cell wall biosynthesis